MIDIESALSSKVAPSDDGKALAPQVDIESALATLNPHQHDLPDAEKPPMWGAFGMIPRIAYDLGSVEYRMSEPVSPENQKKNHIELVSNATGLSQTDVGEYYEPIHFLMKASPLLRVGEAISATVPLPSASTVEGIVHATMTPAIIAAAVAHPIPTAARLVAFTALDYIIPKMEVEGAKADEQATINLVRMLGIGGIIGGAEHGYKKHLDMSSVFDLKDMNTRDLLGKYAKSRLDFEGNPSVITLDPKAIESINKIDAQKRISAKDQARRDRMVSDVADKLRENKELKGATLDPSIVRDAKKMAVEQINALEKENGKLRNRDKQVRFKLKQELAQEVIPIDSPTLEKLGVDKNTAETARANGLGVQVKAEKFVELAIDSKKKFEEVAVVVVGKPKAEPVKAKVEEIKVAEPILKIEAKAPVADANVSAEAPVVVEKTGLTPIEGTGEVKTRGLSFGVEAKAVENKLSKGFGDLPEYKTVKMEDQAQKAVELLSNDPVKARRIAMGEEAAPEGLIPEAVLVAVENKALLEGDVSTLVDLATASRLSAEATTMGQRIATLATRDAESPVGAIKEIKSVREKSVEKSVGKKNVEKVKAETVKEIKAEIKKPKMTVDRWAEFLKEIEC